MNFNDGAGLRELDKMHDDDDDDELMMTIVV